jgi:hypothetical protein
MQLELNRLHVITTMKDREDLKLAGKCVKGISDFPFTLKNVYTRKSHSETPCTAILNQNVIF